MEEVEIKSRVVPIATLVSLFFFGFLTFALANASDINPENIINAVNKEREEQGLEPLKTNEQLQKAAMAKSSDMLARNYFEHYAFGLTPWMFIVKAGYDYSVAGENLAKGYSSAEGVVNAWMNSPEHRKNLLNPNYEDIGVGVVRGVYSENGNNSETVLTTEMMASPEKPVYGFFDSIANFFSRIF